MALRPAEIGDRPEEVHRAAPLGELPARRPSRLTILAVLAISGLYFYANGRVSSSGDNVGTRALAASLATTGSFDLSSALAGDRPNYSVRQVGDVLRIAFPPGTGILAAPIYALAGRRDRLSAAALFADSGAEKAAAVALSLLAVLFFLLLVRGRWSTGSTMAATAVLVAGTPVSTTMSQGLWSHTGELAAFALSFWLSAKPPDSSRGAGAGLAAGFSLWCRPTAFLLFLLPLSLLETWRERARFAMGAISGGLALALLNFAWFGSPFGPYAALNQDKFGFSGTGIASNLLGVIASPSRGLIWYFPALLISLVALNLRKDSPKARRESLAMATVSVLVVLVVASYSRWWGGHSVGPRLLGELSLPCAFCFGAALDQARGRALRIALLVAAGLQIGLFSLLRFSPRSDSWNVDVAIDANPAVRMSFKNSQLRAAVDPAWRYREEGTYFDTEVVESAREGFAWTPIDLGALANARYDVAPPREDRSAVSGTLSLKRLAEQPPPLQSHLRVLPPGAANVVRVCSGESPAVIPVDALPARKIDTLIQFSGAPTARQQAEPAGYLIVSFANDKQTTYPLRFGSHILLRTQLNLEYEKLWSRFFAGSISAPDALQRQRFSLSGRSRVVSGLRLEMPASGPHGCLFLLAVSLGRPLDSPQQAAR